jgi:hypothetical protein
LCAESSDPQVEYEPWKFRIVICSNFNGEATIVGEADTLEAATKRRRGLRQSHEHPSQ